MKSYGCLNKAAKEKLSGTLAHWFSVKTYTQTRTVQSISLTLEKAALESNVIDAFLCVLASFYVNLTRARVM